MKNLRIFLTVGIAMLPLLRHQLPAQISKIEIRVRVIDAHSGKPYTKRDVLLAGTNASSGNLKASETLFTLRAKTDGDGVAHFEINLPMPRSLLFWSANADLCAPSSWYVTGDIVQKILTTGVVVPDVCARKEKDYRGPRITAQPGEIVFFAVEYPIG